MDVFPPLAPVAKVDRSTRLPKYEGTWDELAGQRAGVIGGVKRSFRNGHVSRLADELGVLTIGYGMSIDPEAVNLDFLDRRFLGIEPLRTH
jgi:hypothetical protein